MCKGFKILFMEQPQNKDDKAAISALEIVLINAIQKKDNSFLKKLREFLYNENRIAAANAVETLRRNHFPISIKEEASLAEARQYETILRLMGFRIEQSTAWKMARAFKTYQRKKGKMSLEDSETIKYEAEKLFGE